MASLPGCMTTCSQPGAAELHNYRSKCMKSRKVQIKMRSALAAGMRFGPRRCGSARRCCRRSSEGETNLRRLLLPPHLHLDRVAYPPKPKISASATRLIAGSRLRVIAVR
ncbi:hypothetical protein Sinac_4060 [Singulisphaera acidiphila DSM 18658]|uniref:Uncharacterized protein n=1 Tax=Singulisphaera acidiphila (strain ATCC BAA-1392 / DSM 18658 / VKM B-2454 / MOB10) TaxID=886293 RepID=L0DFY0_SINAD|nr:hypothetical protein Sinac_4060 [Singulisphaera acidiphila DSM 18658]